MIRRRKRKGLDRLFGFLARGVDAATSSISRKAVRSYLRTKRISIAPHGHKRYLVQLTTGEYVDSYASKSKAISHARAIRTRFPLSRGLVFDDKTQRLVWIEPRMSRRKWKR